MTHSTHRSVVALAALSLTLLCAPLAWNASQAHAAVRIQPAASQQASDADGSSDKVAQGATAAQQDLPDTSKLTAVHAGDLEEGTYTIEVASSSSMFRITEAKLTVADGKMTCELTMSGKGYGKLLLKRLARLALQRGCGRLEWACLDWNTPSRKFYDSLGAVRMEEWTTYRLTGDALLSLASNISLK